MEARLWSTQTALPTSSTVHRRSRREPKWRSSTMIVSVLSPEKKPKPMSTTTNITEYKDNWFDRFAIDHLSQSLQSVSGKKHKKKGYDGFIETSSIIARNYSPSDQQELSSLSLKKAFPQRFLSMLSALLPQSRFTRELYASSTTMLFSWLVGPCEVKESEFQGKIEKNVVYIKKCRYLENTNCAGMCVNLCKIPTQKFIHETFNMPINMVPIVCSRVGLPRRDSIHVWGASYSVTMMHVEKRCPSKDTIRNLDYFEDMSCEMIFGEMPPDEDVDPALKQPCYLTLCKAKQSHNVDCSITSVEGVQNKTSQ